MKRAICAGLRQAIFSRGFIISAAGTALILLLSSVQGILAGFRSAELLSPGYHSDLIMGRAHWNSYKVLMSDRR